MKRELYFEDSQELYTHLGSVYNMADAFELIRAKLSKFNYKSYYVRYWIDEALPALNALWHIRFDVGSWSEFFVIPFETLEDAEKFIQLPNE